MRLFISPYSAVHCYPFLILLCFYFHFSYFQAFDAHHSSHNPGLRSPVILMAVNAMANFQLSLDLFPLFLPHSALSLLDVVFFFLSSHITLLVCTTSPSDPYLFPLNLLLWFLLNFFSLRGARTQSSALLFPSALIPSVVSLSLGFEIHLEAIILGNCGLSAIP